MKIREGCVLRRVMGNYVVVATGEASKTFRGMIQLNETAAEIWTLIERGASEAQICDELSKKYDADTEKIKKDVEDTVNTLQKQGLICL